MTNSTKGGGNLPPPSTSNQNPAEALRQHYKQEIEYVLETSDESGEVRITYADGHSEIKPAKVLLLDDIMHFVDAYVTAYAATVEREAGRTAFLSATTWATKYPEADKIWHEMLTEAARLAALQGPLDGSDGHSEPAKS